MPLDRDALKAMAARASELIDCQKCGSRVHPAEHHCFDACQVVKLRQALDAAESRATRAEEERDELAAMLERRTTTDARFDKIADALENVESMTVVQLSKRAERAEAQRDRLAEALRWYAKLEWPRRRNGEAYTPATLDAGQRARAALAEVEKT